MVLCMLLYTIMAHCLYNKQPFIHNGKAHTANAMQGCPITRNTICYQYRGVHVQGSGVASTQLYCIEAAPYIHPLLVNTTLFLKKSLEDERFPAISLC